MESAGGEKGKERKLWQSTSTQAGLSVDETMVRMTKAGGGNEGQPQRFLAAFSSGKERMAAASSAGAKGFVELGLWLRLVGWNEICEETRVGWKKWWVGRKLCEEKRVCWKEWWVKEVVGGWVEKRCGRRVARV